MDKREQIAEAMHEAWAGWIQYMFAKSFINKDETMTIPKWAVDRWTKQADTNYQKLSVEEKESDRAEADKILSLFTIEGIEMEKKCPECENGAKERITQVSKNKATVGPYPCPACKGTSKESRPVTWGDVELKILKSCEAICDTGQCTAGGPCEAREPSTGYCNIGTMKTWNLNQSLMDKGWVIKEGTKE